MADTNVTSVETVEDIGTSPRQIAKRWKLELKLADKREQDWRNNVKDIYKLYTPLNPASNSFNILWTNTETLRQAVYNSLPQPQAKRRYSDEDELGKNVGEVLTRALEFAQDTYDFDAVLKGDVLSMLLAGRSVSRIRYIPDIRQIGSEESERDDDSQESDAYEEIEWEQVICERVQWDDFRISAGKTWDEISWIAFKHRFTREDCIEKFGEEIGKAIKMESVADDDVKKSKDIADLFKTADVWEIWDKDKKQVIFISSTYETPCKTQDDPLKLSGFYPVPRPLYAIENDQSLVPAALYTQYQQQANELNKISIRINKLIEALKLRGVYDATLSELSELMKGADNDLIPSINVTALIERGGLDKAIWMMPIDMAAEVLKVLYEQRDATKQVIYEITGISDIMRSASDPNETYGAQKIKTQWGTQRLQRMQKEVQRYIRDLIRLKAEIIAKKFQPETLEAMTLVNLPHQSDIDQQMQQMMIQYHQGILQAQQSGQPPPPAPQQPNVITWEKVVDAMRSDATRTYRIDIETDSTLSATQDSDMAGMKELLGGISQLIEGFGPAVQQGSIPVEAVKEIILSVVRRAKMGSAVEDAFEKMQQPKPPADPNAGQMQLEQAKIEGQQQLEQFKAQLQDQQHQRELAANAQAEQQSAQLSAQLELHKQQVQAQQVEHQNQLEAQRAALDAQNEAKLETLRQMHDAALEQTRQQFELLMARLDSATKIEVAEISKETTLQSAQISAAQSGEREIP